jgi:ketosteroid isomerase-like protein
MKGFHAARVFMLALALAVTGALMGLPGRMGVAPAAAADTMDALHAEAQMAVEAWVKAVTSGDRAVIGKILAPDFLIVRDDGSILDREGYLKSDLPVIATLPTVVGGFTVTTNGDTMVVAYDLDANQTRDGKKIQSLALRLTVFRKSGDTWLVVAHANFAKVVH